MDFGICLNGVDWEYKARSAVIGMTNSDGIQMQATAAGTSSVLEPFVTSRTAGRSQHKARGAAPREPSLFYSAIARRHTANHSYHFLVWPADGVFHNRGMSGRGQGRWDVDETVRKVYVIHQSPAK